MLTNKENALIALEGGVPESVPCYFSSCQIIPQFFMETPPMGQPSGYDGFGVHQTATANTGGMFTPTPDMPPVLDDVTKWKDVVQFPDYDKLPLEDIFNQTLATVHADPEHFVQDFLSPNGMFERIHFLMGFEEAMFALAEEPEACYDLAGAIADTKIQLIHYVGKYIKPDYFTYLDDFTHLRGRFISDSTFEEIFKPHYQRIIDAVKNDGMKFKTHCCGKEELMLDQFMSMGVRTFDPAQPCNDIQAMKKKGKIGIMGGLDIQGTVDIEGVTEEQLRAEIRRCIDSYAEGGAYTIYGASVHMYNPAQFAPNGVIGILMDETEKYGKGYYLKQVS